MTHCWCAFVCVQLGMLQEGAEQAQRQEAAAKAVLKAAQVGPFTLLELPHEHCWQHNATDAAQDRLSTAMHSRRLVPDMQQYDIDQCLVWFTWCWRHCRRRPASSGRR